MKAMKKNPQKQVVNGGGTIESYFKSAPKANEDHVVCTVGTSSETKSVFIRALKDQLKSYDERMNVGTSDTNKTQEKDTDDVAETSAIVDVDQTSSCDGCSEWRKKYEELKKTHVKLSLRHCELQLKYDDLAKYKSTTTIASNERSPEEMPTTDTIFTESELQMLQSIPLDRKKDSTFVLHCVQYAYKENAASLVGKTLKGTRERIEFNEDGTVQVIHPAKAALTPEKVRRIEELFIKRVSDSKCLSSEYGERLKLTNQLIGSAVKNLSNKEKSNVKTTSKNVELDL